MTTENRKNQYGTGGRKKDHSVPHQARASREGWDEHFQRMAKNGDDRLLDEADALPTQWESEKWQW